jgi:hypothetical protein
MPTYVKKVVNGTLTTCNAGDQVVLAARDAADWSSNPAPPALAATAAEKIVRMGRPFGLTIAELKAVINGP